MGLKVLNECRKIVTGTFFLLYMTSLEYYYLCMNVAGYKIFYRTDDFFFIMDSSTSFILNSFFFFVYTLYFIKNKIKKIIEWKSSNYSHLSCLLYFLFVLLFFLHKRLMDECNLLLVASCV